MKCYMDLVLSSRARSAEVLRVAKAMAEKQHQINEKKLAICKVCSQKVVEPPRCVCKKRA